MNKEILHLNRSDDNKKIIVKHDSQNHRFEIQYKEPIKNIIDFNVWECDIFKIDKKVNYETNTRFEDDIPFTEYFTSSPIGIAIICDSKKKSCLLN